MNPKKTIAVLAGILFFIPVFPVVVIPEWNLLLVDTADRPVVDARIDQRWRDYSLEFWAAEEHLDETRSSDSEGVVTLPRRVIWVSGAEYLAAKLRNIVASANPHSSYGPHSYVLCRGKLNCHAIYRPGDEMPTRITVLQ
jgi:hypothetical protein